VRYLPAHLVAFTLALLLVGTTPTGTGAGVHQFDVLHPLFSHVHVINGRVMTHEQIQQGQAAPRPAASHATPGPAFGAGSANVQGDAGLGISPIVPFLSVSLRPDPFGSRLAVEPRLLVGRVEAPPDPPPTSAA
jgi:hypothetical protein